MDGAPGVVSGDADRNGIKYIFEVPAGTLKTTPNVVARLKYIDNSRIFKITGSGVPVARPA